MDNNFSDILNIFKRLDESTKFANESADVTSPKQKYRVEVTVSDPKNTMVSQRKETKRRVCKVTAADESTAVDTAIAWYRKQGYKVHDHHFIGPEEELKELGMPPTGTGASATPAAPGTSAPAVANPAQAAQDAVQKKAGLQKTLQGIPGIDVNKAITNLTDPTDTSGLGSALSTALSDPTKAGKIKDLLNNPAGAA
jgi:hypothetical protein